MNRRTRGLMDRLLEVHGPSGHEREAGRAWREEAETFADRVWLDVHGNSFAEVGEGGSPRVMLAGHIDEIGLMVHHVDDEGFLYLKGVGGWDPQVLVGQRVEILAEDGPVSGVIGWKAIHLIDRKERSNAVKLKDLWIDIGAEDADEARERVSVGDVAVIQSDPLDLANGRVAARSADDRLGALVALEALRRAAEKGMEAHGVAVATTQEEISYKTGGGASTSTFGLEPDAAVVIDVTHATDHPSVERTEHGLIELGKGPVLSRGSVVNPILFERLVEAARSADLSYQVLASPSTTGTDADSIFTTGAGVATAIVSIPDRYMHTPNQTVSTGDVEDAAELIAELLASLDPGISFLPE